MADPNMDVRDRDRSNGPAPPSRIGEVFLAFLRLGLTSFGGPVAHLGYFRNELVLKRKWVDEDAYAHLVALCQFLPGPASSQTGFALGVLRGGGLIGGLAAWCGFTLPSAAVMLGFALAAARLEGPLARDLLHGLQLVAVAVVAQAVWGMARALTPDRVRAGIALIAVLLATLVGGGFAQLAAIVAGAVLGLLLCRDDAAAPAGDLNFPVTRAQGAAALILFAVLLFGLPLIPWVWPQQAIALFNAFYQSGALVFGGGHVVLPLLEGRVVAPGWTDLPAFLSGYGVAQAVPGPLFTFAAYLGAVVGPQPNGVAGSILALISIFLPGLLLVYGAIPFWAAFRRRLWAQAAMRGANAAVVGILAAALYDPVWTTGVRGPVDFALAAIGFVLLTAWKTPPIIVVATLAAASAAGAQFFAS